ncbi:hypothetical protein DENIT_110152 [Pseudomonas veronii]|nr:hypothetical protein DENIT_110152 [Pseudomonas veronii]
MGAILGGNAAAVSGGAPYPQDMAHLLILINPALSTPPGQSVARASDTVFSLLSAPVSKCHRGGQ